MSLDTINGIAFNELLETGYKNLLANYQIINDLNVFPVPDGDTGTNMKLTYSNGLKTISGDQDSVSKICEEFARGTLFGARGNSGVLTSQYFRGFAEALAGKKDLSVKDFREAMVSAYKNAYKACINVAEGTILTVAREGIENVTLEKDDDFVSFLRKVVIEMKKSLDNTPNLLPVLKENGVIDSGGKGLLVIFEGFLSFFTGEDIKVEVEEEVEKPSKEPESLPLDFSAFNENSVLEYGYCTEFLLQLLTSKVDIPSFDINPFIGFLQEHGDSLVCFQTGTIVKVHVHTKKPYEIIEFAQRYGEFVAFKMENMSLQHNNVMIEEQKKNETRKSLAFISIAQGDGIIELFKNLGSDMVINGGQTMNTSVSELVEAFKLVNADNIILLPNETNMLKAAQQAADLYKDSKVQVIETRTIPEGYYVLTNKFCLEGVSDDDVYDTLKECNEGFTSLTVFKSAKDATIGDEIAPKGCYVEAVGHRLIGYSNDIIESTIDLLSKTEDINFKDVIILMYGQAVSEETANNLKAKINEKYPNLEVDLLSGKQDVYDLLIGLY